MALALAWPGVSGIACASDFSFGRPERLTLALDSATGVAVGDVDGDGRGDLAATSILADHSHEVVLFLQGADGVLRPTTSLPLPESYSQITPVGIADLDRDGRGEVVVGIGTGGLRVVRPDGAGGLASTAYESLYQCRYMDTGDINGDGHVDVVCHDWKETASLYYGDGTGGFGSPEVLRTPVGSYSDRGWKQVRLADVTGDGRLDLLVTASDIISFSIFANNGLGGFWPARVYVHPPSPGQVWSTSIEVLDIDGDGAAEVVTASPETGQFAMLNVYRRQASGFLALAERVPVHDSPTALKVADVDGDGDGELLVGHFSFGATTVLGAGGEGLSGKARFELPGFGSNIPAVRYQGHSGSLALGDLDSDGCNDLAAATQSGVVVLHGCRPPSNSVPVLDYDGDGVSDLMLRSQEVGVNQLWRWASLEAWYRCSLPCPRAQTSEWHAAATGDFDGDGSSDLFWRNKETGANQVWDRGFYPRAITGVANLGWHVLGAGDFDGDDRSDLFWRNSSTGANRIWKSADSSQAQAAGTVRDQRWRLMGVGDFNGDRRSDLLWRHSTNGRNVVWWSANPASQKPLPTVDNLDWTVAGVGDLNGDGRDDVVWRNTSTGTNTAWLSASSSTPRPIATVRDLGWRVAAVGDFNGDGEADLMWRHADGRNTIWHSGDSRRVQQVESMDASIMVVR